MAQARYSGMTASGLYCCPTNTMGIGNPQAPQGDCRQTTGIGDTAKDFHDQVEGSGDLIV